MSCSENILKLLLKILIFIYMGKKNIEDFDIKQHIFF